jgi:hypothetical protein
MSRTPAYVTLMVPLNSFMDHDVTSGGPFDRSPDKECTHILLAFTGSGKLIPVRKRNGTPTSACAKIGKLRP